MDLLVCSSNALWFRWRSELILWWVAGKLSLLEVPQRQSDPITAVWLSSTSTWLNSWMADFCSDGLRLLIGSHTGQHKSPQIFFFSYSTWISQTWYEISQCWKKPHAGAFIGHPNFLMREYAEPLRATFVGGDWDDSIEQILRTQYDMGTLYA